MKTLETLKSRIAAPESKEFVTVIEGHSDEGENKKVSGQAKGSESDLSRLRAEYVRNWLNSALGRPFANEVKSYGSAVPAPKNGVFPGIFKNASKNRRVEVRLYAKDSVPRTEGMNASAAGDGSKIFVPEMEFTFKAVYENEPVVHDYIVKNIGKTPLEIFDVKPG
jgi:hypothetical protein